MVDFYGYENAVSNRRSSETYYPDLLTSLLIERKGLWQAFSDTKQLVKLPSGMISDTYLDTSVITNFPDVVARVLQPLVPFIKPCFVAVSTDAIPFTYARALKHCNSQVIYTEKCRCLYSGSGLHFYFLPSSNTQEVVFCDNVFVKDRIFESVMKTLRIESPNVKFFHTVFTLVNFSLCDSFIVPDIGTFKIHSVLNLKRMLFNSLGQAQQFYPMVETTTAYPFD